MDSDGITFTIGWGAAESNNETGPGGLEKEGAPVLESAGDELVMDSIEFSEEVFSEVTAAGRGDGSVDMAVWPWSSERAAVEAEFGLGAAPSQFGTWGDEAGGLGETISLASSFFFFGGLAGGG